MLRNVAVTSTLYLQQEKEQLALIQILARYAIAQIIHHLLHDYFFSASAITYICIEVSFRERFEDSVAIGWASHINIVFIFRFCKLQYSVSDRKPRPPT